MAKEIFDNPAWRLYDVIGAAIEFRGGTVMQLWAQVFGVKATDCAAVFRGLMQLHDLVDATERTLRQADIDHDYFLKNMATIRAAVSITNLEAASSGVVSLLAPIHREVGYWARQINTTEFAIRLGDDELSALAADVQDVSERVRDAGIDEELKRVLLDSLEGLRRAISEYRLRGSAGLQEELEQLVARLARYAEQLKQYVDEPWANLLFRMLMKADAAAQKGRKFLPLIKNAANLLLPGSFPGT